MARQADVVMGCRWLPKRAAEARDRRSFPVPPSHPWTSSQLVNARPRQPARDESEPRLHPSYFHLVHFHRRGHRNVAVPRVLSITVGEAGQAVEGQPPSRSTSAPDGELPLSSLANSRRQTLPKPCSSLTRSALGQQASLCDTRHGVAERGRGLANPAPSRAMHS